MGIIKLEPIIKNNPWGGSLLKQQGFCDVDEKVGEIWGVSDFEEFPLLMKIIGAEEDLSIQVHPDDEYARANENEPNGKTECWYILSCDEDSSIVLGHTAQSKEELKEKVSNNEWNELLYEIPVHKGDFYYIEPGTIHSIRGGITLLEIQQKSDTTYRLYDFDREYGGKKRELHLDKALDMAKAPYQESKHNKKSQQGEETILCNSEMFLIKRIETKGGKNVSVAEAFAGIAVIDGEGSINDTKVQKGDFLISTPDTEELDCKGDMTIIVSSYNR